MKKQRDRSQAIAVAYLVLKYLPQHKFTPSELRMFPKDVVDAAADDLSRHDLPAGFSEDR